MRINVHAGHNPDGKVGCGAIGIIRESTENRNVKNEVIRLLTALGHEVYDCTVDNGTSANNVLTNIVKKCNAHEVDLDVSIHFNSGRNDYSGDGSIGGTEVFVYSKTSKALEYAKGVANALKGAGYRLRKDGTSPADGVKINSSLYVLRKTSAPAMLIECCFVDDKDDVALYDYKSVAEAIVYGITGQRYEEPTNDERDDDASLPGAETAVGNKDVLYRVVVMEQKGAFAVKENAEKLLAKLKAAGFDAAVVKA